MSATVDEKILDRLAKLLELAERGDENEAKVAAARAAELMARHELSAADVAMRAGRDVEIVEGRVDASDEDAAMSRVEKWHKMLIAAVARASGGRAFFQGRGKLAIFRMIGTHDAVATARYLYASLARQIARLSREAMRREGETQNAWRRAYCLGVVARVAERLEQARRSVMVEYAGTTAMVHVDRTKARIDEMYEARDLRPMKTRAQLRPDAGSVGYRDGDEVDVGGHASLAEGRRRLRS